jgi:hypothetical protein
MLEIIFTYANNFRSPSLKNIPELVFLVYKYSSPEIGDFCQKNCLISFASKKLAPIGVWGQSLKLWSKSLFGRRLAVLPQESPFSTELYKWTIWLPCSGAGFPDGLFSNQKSQICVNF